MGMGYAANFVETIEQNFVKETCPKEFQKFVNEFDKDENITLEEFARNASQDENDHDTKAFKAFDKLTKAFKDKVGLDLYLGYHDQENDGDRYDDVNGVYWYLDFNEVYKLTPAAKKIADKISRQFFVNFG